MRMKWSWKIGEFAGIPVYLHATFLLLLAWIAFSHWLQSRSFWPTVGAVGFMVAIFACVVFHECGHALMARRFGIATKDITLLPIGGLARLDRMPEKPAQELWVALAGPAVNLGIAAILGSYLLLSNHLDPIASLGVARGNFVERLLIANLFLVGFNMIPAFPMDGGRVLRALLAGRLDYARATRVAAGIVQALAFVFGLWGLVANPFLMIIALFVWIGAAQEAAMVETKSYLEGVSVRAAMIQNVEVLSPKEKLSKAVEFVRTSWQQDFPVVENDRVIGMLLRSDVFSAIANGRIDPQICELMRRDFPVADPLEPLESAYSRLHRTDSATISIVRKGELLGLLTLEHLTEFVLIQAALKTARYAAGSTRARVSQSREVQNPA